MWRVQQAGQPKEVSYLGKAVMLILLTWRHHYQCEIRDPFSGLEDRLKTLHRIHGKENISI